MWDKIAEFLVVALAFVSAPFVMPEPPVVMEQPPVQGVVEEAAAQSPPVATSPEAKPAEPVVQVAPVKAVDPYCAQYAFRYSAEKYKVASEEPKKVKKSCEKGGGSDSITDLAEEQDCADKEKKAKKEFESWKKKYDEYKVRCP